MRTTNGGRDKMKKVMIIGDENRYYEELRENEPFCGYSFTVVSAETAGIDNIKDEMPDYILLDPNLKGRSGLEILYDLKNCPDLCGIPVIAMSTYYIEEEVMRSYGIMKKLVKPFYPIEVLIGLEEISVGEVH
jgi:CheY-like chemotaxis protein